jgi:hypothetical protein
VASVLVSDIFLQSHAYLRDAAVRIDACTLTSKVWPVSPGSPNDARTLAANAALRQAGLEREDIQVVEALESVGQTPAAAFDSLNGSSPTSRDTEPPSTALAAAQASLDALSGAPPLGELSPRETCSGQLGPAGLCGLGAIV